MFCVIQEIETKKPNKNGHPKELISQYSKMSIGGKDCSHYLHYYSNERFERPIMKAYRIIIHHSYRENGKVRKRQFSLCTANYYDFADDIFTVYDFCDSKIRQVSEALSRCIDDIYELVEEKVRPLEEQIQEEFHKTEEYITHQKHEEITTIYAAKKVQFAQEYGVDSSEYDKCYDVFGELRNPEYLEKIKREYKQRKKFQEEYGGYYEKFYGNYNSYSSNHGSGYGNYERSNYADDDKEILRQFYRELSKKFHPDANPDKDTSQQMKMLNQLKQEWGV